MAAMELLETATLDGIHGVLLDPRNRVEFLRPGVHSMRNHGYRYFSLIPVDGMLLEVTDPGSKIPAGTPGCAPGDSLTVSNEFSGSKVEISFTSGCCYFIESI